MGVVISGYFLKPNLIGTLKHLSPKGLSQPFHIVREVSKNSISSINVTSLTA